MIRTQHGTAYINTSGDPRNAIGSETTTEDALHAHAAYMELPDLRLDKVHEVQRRIAAGLFHPSAEELADAILASAANSLLCK